LGVGHLAEYLARRFASICEFLDEYLGLGKTTRNPHSSWTTVGPRGKNGVKNEMFC
jgi:hypothetical protein